VARRPSSNPAAARIKAPEHACGAPRPGAGETDKGQCLEAGCGFSAPPTAGDNQCVERVVEEALRYQLRTGRADHRPGGLGNDSQPIGRRRGIAGGCIKSRDRPRRIEKLEIRKDQNGDRAHVWK
jgi:hypothetical protein